MSMPRPLINSLEMYEWSGRRAGKARRQQDEPSAKFEQDWFSRAKALEDKAHHADIDAAWRKGYQP